MGENIKIEETTKIMNQEEIVETAPVETDEEIITEPTTEETFTPPVQQHYYYAQITPEGICCGLSDLSGEVIADDMIQLESYDMSVMGRKWDGESWLEVEVIIPEEPEENVSAVTLEEIRDMQLIQMEAMAEQYEQSEINRLNDLEVQATIYETLLNIQEGGMA